MLHEKFKALILMDKSTVKHFVSGEPEDFMMKVEADLKVFAQGMSEWIKDTILKYWKTCVIITQERILMQSNNCNKNKFWNQACMKIVSNFLTTLTASANTKEIIEGQLKILQTKMKGEQEDLELLLGQIRSEAKCSGTVLEAKLLRLRISEDVISKYKENPDEVSTTPNTPDLQHQILKSDARMHLSKLIQAFQNTNTTDDVLQDPEWRKKMKKLNMKRATNITGDFFSVIAGLKNRAAQSDEEVQGATNIERLFYAFYNGYLMIKEVKNREVIF